MNLHARYTERLEIKFLFRVSRSAKTFSFKIIVMGRTIPRNQLLLGRPQLIRKLLIQKPFLIEIISQNVFLAIPIFFAITF